MENLASRRMDALLLYIEDSGEVYYQFPEGRTSIIIILLYVFRPTTSYGVEIKHFLVLARPRTDYLPPWFRVALVDLGAFCRTTKYSNNSNITTGLYILLPLPLLLLV